MVLGLHSISTHQEYCRLEWLMEQLWSNGLVLRRWIPNPGVLFSRPLGCSKVDSAFHLSEIDKMSTRNFLELNGKTSLFDKDKAIKLASEHLPFALSLAVSKYLNNSMLMIRTHCLKKIPTKYIFLSAKKKEIDNIQRTLFEFMLIKSQKTITFYKCKLYW